MQLICSNFTWPLTRKGGDQWSIAIEIYFQQSDWNVNSALDKKKTKPISMCYVHAFIQVLKTVDIFWRTFQRDQSFWSCFRYMYSTDILVGEKYLFAILNQDFTYLIFPNTITQKLYGQYILLLKCTQNRFYIMSKYQ